MLSYLGRCFAFTGGRSHWRAKRAGPCEDSESLLFYATIENEFTWRSSETHNIKRSGFPLTHANYLTSTSSQGVTIRTGVTIDCARVEQEGAAGGKSEEDWWLHLYVMFSRATCMEDMLLLRPPPRALLERGPPPAVKKALAKFETTITESVAMAEALAAELGFSLPQ